MTIERHFPMLEAPPGGLARLRARLDRSSRRSWFRPAAVLAVMLAVLVSVPWLLDSAQTRQRESHQLSELRRTLAEHRRPDLAINGQQPTPLMLDSDRLEAYFVNGGG
ncbi:hypothetical protein [Wenzhouxiangella sp. EGI_FJ10305]|uniref:hypothetical protein n=1 Tax=Wenzhouxiangella sp. EGI_FJ10305 TaxID=3243768 RepID=UPI0035D7C3E3